MLTAQDNQGKSVLVIGITGKAVSGKNLVAHYLEKYRFTQLDFTKNLLAPLLKKRHKPVIRKNLINLGLELRKTHGGKDALIKLLCEKMEPGRHYVIAGMRYPEEVNYLRKRFGRNFTLLAVKCRLGIRYQRTLELYHVRRKMVGGKDITFKEFMKLEDLPTEKIISRAIRMADYAVTNEGAKEELLTKIDNIIRKLKV